MQTTNVKAIGIDAADARSMDKRNVDAEFPARPVRRAPGH